MSGKENKDDADVSVDFTSFETMRRSPSLVEIIPDVLYWISNNKMLVYDSVPGAYIYNCDFVSKLII